ncbi:MAG: [Bacteroidales bacterium]|nr:[FeFe] hydrogenase H-cluster maturation GTPase HydF [Bacteroidales bacterium]
METPGSERLSIAFVGRRNAGKSSLVNAIAGQSVSIVSDIPGTTTDPVRKAIELPHLGACVLIDTAGLGDVGALGSFRESATHLQIEKADIVVLVCVADAVTELVEEPVVSNLKASGTPFIAVLNKADTLDDPAQAAELLAMDLGVKPLVVSAASGHGIPEMLDALLDKVPADFGQRSLLGGLVSEGDLVVLVMPQDSEAPKGRLIMPQARVIRELLDKGNVSINCTPESFKATLNSLSRDPDLVIVDSSVFKSVAPEVPQGTRLTSFSILMAAFKGDISYFVESAKAIDLLRPGDKVLIAESCSHVPAGEDIGRVKLPAMLRKTLSARFGLSADTPPEDILDIDTASGNDFPRDLSEYSLIIHCGGCVFSRKHLLSRVEAARRQGIPMTNYGVAMAFLTGILPKVVIPSE